MAKNAVYKIIAPLNSVMFTNVFETEIDQDGLERINDAYDKFVELRDGDFGIREITFDENKFTMHESIFSRFSQPDVTLSFTDRGISFVSHMDIEHGQPRSMYFSIDELNLMEVGLNIFLNDNLNDLEDISHYVSNNYGLTGMCKLIRSFERSNNKPENSDWCRNYISEMIEVKGLLESDKTVDYIKDTIEKYPDYFPFLHNEEYSPSNREKTQRM